MEKSKKRFVLLKSAKAYEKRLQSGIDKKVADVIKYMYGRNRRIEENFEGAAECFNVARLGWIFSHCGKVLFCL